MYSWTRTVPVSELAGSVECAVIPRCVAFDLIRCGVTREARVNTISPEYILLTVAQWIGFVRRTHAV